MKPKHYIQAGLVALAATMGGVSCTDTWDDHYSVGTVGAAAGSNLWELLQQDESLKNFVAVLDTCGYDVLLSSNQVFTVWAPEITEEEAQSWIDLYNADSNKDEDNTAIHQFVRNHIALYRQQLTTSTNDTILMLNTKRMHRTYDVMDADRSPVNVLDSTSLASNGMLYRLDGALTFFPNIWESIQADTTAVSEDDRLDSVANYFMRWEHEELDEESSVAGGVVDGETYYLDSVTYSYNEYFNLMNGLINSEDSLYWFLAPTNKAWRDNIDRYLGYFEYHDELGTDGDSLQDLRAKQMMLFGSFYNVRSQPSSNFNSSDPDSICSTAYSKANPGYYMFEWPLREGGIFYGLEAEECSNGYLFKTSEWLIPDSKSSFMQEVKVEAENPNNYTTATLDGDTESVQVTRVTTSSDLYSVSSSGYLLVRDVRTTRSNCPEVTFNIPNTLSNCPYTIKVVFATPLAGDTLNVEDAQLKRQITALIRYYTSTSGSILAANRAQELCSDVDVDASRMDTVTVAEDFVFPVCNYGEEDSRVLLTIQSISGRPTSVPDGYAKELLIDCIILEPHPDDDAEGDD